MSLVQAFFLGMIQGATEFLPVSSSGHLALAQYFFQLNDVPLLFDLLLHIATLIAVTIVFRKKIIRLLVAPVSLIKGVGSDGTRSDAKMILYILAALLVTGFIGYPLKELHLKGSPQVVAIALLFTAAILFLTFFFKGGNKSITLIAALIIGIAQGTAVLPGISRSGLTIAAALLLGIDREDAGEFSFLISLPAIIGGVILDLKDAGELFAVVSPGALIVAFLTAFLFGLFSLLFLLSLIRWGQLGWFAAYLIPLGIVTLLLL